MVLRKLSKKVIYGSTLLGHYGRDLSDLTIASATFTNWGEQVDYTPVHGDSNMEVCVTGSIFNNTNHRADTQEKSQCRIMINGEEEYRAVGIGHKIHGIGALTRYFHNPRFSQHNARQQFHANNFGTGLFMNHMHQVRDTNLLEFQCQVQSDGNISVVYSDGYITITEMSVDQFGNQPSV
jgi:hypothetical protein